MDEAARILAEARRVVALTGAGVSAESGVPVFRGSAGLWRQFRPEDLATPEAFARDPKLVWEWYAWRQGLVGACQPNAGHLALARLESEKPGFLLVTQNVDGLHARAASHGRRGGPPMGRILELHGNLWKARCVSGCGVREFIADGVELPPRCECGALLRPHIVWFGERLDERTLEQAAEAAEACDAFLVVGTSAQVYPAAILPVIAARSGAAVIEVNTGETAVSDVATVSLRGPSAEILPRLVDAALSGSFQRPGA